VRDVARATSLTPNTYSTPPHPGPPTYYNIRTTHHIAVTTVLRSWRWANDYPKHVELIQRSIKLLLLHLVDHLYYSPTLMMHGQTQIKFMRGFSRKPWQKEIIWKIHESRGIVISLNWIL